MFSDKLNFLMKLTNVQSSSLGNACNLNASYVSRLRSGARALPKRPEFLPEMSAYIARHVKAEYQKSVISSTLGVNPWPSDNEQAAKIIEKWLAGNDEPVPDIASILESLSYTRLEKDIISLKQASLPRHRNYYYGIKGKQEAVLQFFKLILKEKTPQTLYLLSEEAMEWLYEDPEFTAAWKVSFTKVLKAGNRVKIIHSIGRNMNEMLEAVSKWIPIYTTGMIEPYYYPKLRDEIFQRTLFIAPKTAAVVSSSVCNRSDGMLNELTTDKAAVSALAKEFENYFEMCRPLMNIMTPDKADKLWKVYSDIMDGDGDVICMSGMPTLTTMPEKVAKDMQKRAPESDILIRWNSARELVNSLSGKNSLTEIINLPNRRLLKPNLFCADLYNAAGLRYTRQEWVAHVDSSAQFEENHKNFRQILRKNIPGNICLFIKEGRGSIMIKGDSPAVSFAFTEPNLVNSFWDYATRLI